MIDIGMYVALGFLVASLLALMLVPPLWNRAVRLTMRKVEATMPLSIADIQADKDQIRAEYAIELRRVEVALDKAKDKGTRELVEANKRRVEIADLRKEVEAVKARLQEKDNANRVLEQTIRRRLPELELRLKAAKDVITSLESANAELRTTGANQAEALRMARSTMSVQRGDIDQLRGALEGDGASSRRFRSDAALTKENRRLSAELSKLKEELVHGKVGGRENELLSEELGKLARQILAVAREQGTTLPEFPAREARPADFGVTERPAEPEAPPIADDDAGSERADPPFFPEPREEPVLAHPRDMVEDEAASDASEASIADHDAPDAGARDAEPAAAAADDETAKQGSLARILSTRRAAWRGGKGRRDSLSERLKNVRAEASDL